MDAIQTDYIDLPIPERWRAWRDPEGAYGFGATEDEAIADLLDKEAA